MISNITQANTDNKINRFVTFFALAFNHLDSLVIQDKPGPCLPAGRRAPAFYKTLCTLTCYLLAIKLVPRHSYTSASLYPDGKKCAMLRSFRLCVGTLLITEEL
jgi:hypothetical protein